tara:strand:- start:384 stop:584 length:201 start_codon:yes stop_codon:yes gene_type:complete
MRGIGEVISFTLFSGRSSPLTISVQDCISGKQGINTNAKPTPIVSILVNAIETEIDRSIDMRKITS